MREHFIVVAPPRVPEMDMGLVIGGGNPEFDFGAAPVSQTFAGWLPLHKLAGFESGYLYFLDKLSKPEFQGLAGFGFTPRAEPYRSYATAAA
jgi:hypothetical protein